MHRLQHDASVAGSRTGGISADRCPGHNPLILPRLLDIGLLVSLMRTYRKFSSLAEGIPTSGSYVYIYREVESVEEM